MENNLWEIINFADLKKIIFNAVNKFVVLSIVTDDTDIKIKKMIKLFIKEKAKVYPKITFLYYKAKEEDFGKLEPMFNKNKDHYPKMYHIWNVREIFTGITSIDTREVLDEGLYAQIPGTPFKNLHEVYKNGIPITQNKDSVEEDSDNDSYPESSDENIPSNSAPKKKDDKLKNNQHKIKEQTHNYPTTQFKDPKLEKKKFEEKISLLQNKQKEYIVEFMEICRQKKEREEKNNIK